MSRWQWVSTALVAGVCICSGQLAAGAAPQGSVRTDKINYSGLQLDVATITIGVQFQIRAAQSAGSVNSLQPVTSDCQGCAVAVNGDYFNPNTGQPIGGVIIGGVVWRSPNSLQNQLTISPGGKISAGNLGWQGSLTASDGSQLSLAVNDPAATTAVLYDRHWGEIPPAYTTELNFRPLRWQALHLGQGLGYAYIGPHPSDHLAAPGSVVVAGNGPAIAGLQQQLDAGVLKRKVVIRLDTTPPAENSLGANHILIRDGQLQPIAENDCFVFCGHPRTLFGWNADGVITLMTIGSTQPGVRAGVSLPQAAEILRARGVQNAVNLDGGGSSTFVDQGQVVNNPSDGVSRSVSNAWVVTIASVGRPLQSHLAPPVTKPTFGPVAPPPSPPTTTSPTTTTTAAVPTTTTTIAKVVRPSRQPRGARGAVAEPRTQLAPETSHGIAKGVIQLIIVVLLILIGAVMIRRWRLLR